MAVESPERQQVIGSGRLGLVVIALLAAVVILAAFQSMRRGAIPVRAAEAMRGTISTGIATNGKIEAVDNFEAHAPSPTTVKRVLVHEGDQVKRGQLLLQLDDSDARSQAARALAQLRAAEADLNAIQVGGTHEELLTNQTELTRAQTELQAAQHNLEALRKLQETGAASTGEVQNAEVRVKNAENQVKLLQQKTTGSRYSVPERERVDALVAQARAAYEAAQDLVTKSNVTAPRDGTVYSLPVKQGAFVNTGDLLVQAADLSQVMVRAFIDEPDIGRLTQNQTVTVTWDALPGRSWNGTVTQVPTTVTVRGARTVGEVTCVVDNADRKLLPNVNVSVAITTARDDNALTVPREAVHQDDGRRYVYQVVGNELQKKEVVTRIANLTRIEIVNGIPDNALIALGSVNGQPLREGTQVRIQK
ncbi:MAG TPA: efflux RND transporter periplasmic adaptor subunit [Terriglobales bacterium]|nr:efflux RND transporter periplasmic adaptor subunit [Terriglobales bacterium]